jgi:hypothetical protein
LSRVGIVLGIVASVTAVLAFLQTSNLLPWQTGKGAPIPVAQATPTPTVA